MTDTTDALASTVDFDGSDVGAVPYWDFIRAFKDADTLESVWVWKHWPRGAGVIVRVPNGHGPGVPPVAIINALMPDTNFVWGTDGR